MSWRPEGPPNKANRKAAHQRTVSARPAEDEFHDAQEEAAKDALAAKSEAAKVLAETMSDENSKVRRRAMAALGELSFYVATQKRPDAPQVWGSTDRVIDVFIDTLEREEDEVTKHYACKSIENIVSHEASTWIREAFAECRVASILFSIATVSYTHLTLPTILLV